MAPNAFAQGQEFFAAQQRRRAVDNALAALIQRYGPEAADPGSLAALQGIEQSEQLFPYQMRGVQRADDAQRAAVQAVGPLAGDPVAQGAVTADNVRRRQAGLSAALMLESTARRKGDIGATFDRLQTVFPALGIPAEQLAPLREQLVNDPEYVSDLVAMLRTGEGADELVRRALGNPVPVYDERGQLRYLQNYNIGEPELLEGVTPATAAQAEIRLGQGDQRIDIAGRRLSLDEARAAGFDAPPGTQLEQLPDGTIVARMIAGTPQAIEQEGQLAERVGKLNTSIRDLTTADEIATAGIEAIDDVLARAADIGEGPLRTLFRSGAARFPGTEAYYLAERITDVSRRNMLQALQNIDASLMPVSNTDAAALESAYGNLSITQEPDVLLRNLRRIKEIYERSLERSTQVRSRANDELQRAQSTRANLTRRAPPPADAPLDDLINFYSR